MKGFLHNLVMALVIHVNNCIHNFDRKTLYLLKVRMTYLEEKFLRMQLSIFAKILTYTLIFPIYLKKYTHFTIQHT